MKKLLNAFEALFLIRAIETEGTVTKTSLPLIFETEWGHLGIIPCDGAEPTLKALGSARSFLKKYPQAKVAIACRTDTASTRDYSTFIIPYYWLS